MAKKGSLAALDAMRVMWTPFEVVLTFDIPGSPLRGTRPADPAKTRKFLELRAATDPAYKKLVAQGGAAAPTEFKQPPRPLDVMESDAVERLPKRGELDLPPTENPGDPVVETAVVFDRSPDDERRCQVNANNLRAHFKQAIEMMMPGWRLAIPEALFPGSLVTRLKDHLYVTAAERTENGKLKAVSYADILGMDEQPFTGKPTIIETPAIVDNGYGGKRACLKMVEQIQDCKLKFIVLWRDDEWIEKLDSSPMRMIATLLRSGCISGFGGDRNMKMGQYHWELRQLAGGRSVERGGPDDFLNDLPAVPVEAQA